MKVFRLVTMATNQRYFDWLHSYFSSLMANILAYTFVLLTYKLSSSRGEKKTLQPRHGARENK